MKVISKWRLGNLLGSLYETKLAGEIHYVYKIRYNKKVAQSYVYFRDKDECLNRMNDDMYYLYDGDNTLFNLKEITKQYDIINKPH